LLMRRLFFVDLRVAEAQTDTLVGEMVKALIWTSEGVQGPRGVTTNWSDSQDNRLSGKVMAM